MDYAANHDMAEEARIRREPPTSVAQIGAFLTGFAGAFLSTIDSDPTRSLLVIGGVVLGNEFWNLGDADGAHRIPEGVGIVAGSVAGWAVIYLQAVGSSSGNGLDVDEFMEGPSA